MYNTTHMLQCTVVCFLLLSELTLCCKAEKIRTNAVTKKDTKPQQNENSPGCNTFCIFSVIVGVLVVAPLYVLIGVNLSQHVSSVIASDPLLLLVCCFWPIYCTLALIYCICRHISACSSGTATQLPTCSSICTAIVATSGESCKCNQKQQEHKYVDHISAKYWESKFKSNECAICFQRFHHDEHRIVANPSQKQPLFIKKTPTKFSLLSAFQKSDVTACCCCCCWSVPSVHHHSDVDTCVTPCGHFYHRGCIEDVLKRTQYCPNCRGMILDVSRCYFVQAKVTSNNTSPREDQHLLFTRIFKTGGQSMGVITTV